VYMFTGHDENDAKFFKMKEWFVFESEDLVNWKSLGAPLNLETFEWAKKDDKAWASQAVALLGQRHRPERLRRFGRYAVDGVGQSGLLSCEAQAQHGGARWATFSRGRSRNR